MDKKLYIYKYFIDSNTTIKGFRLNLHGSRTNILFMAINLCVCVYKIVICFVSILIGQNLGMFCVQLKYQISQISHNILIQYTF